MCDFKKIIILIKFLLELGPIPIIKIIIKFNY